MFKPRKLILKNGQSPGDIVMLTAAIRDLHLSHPGKFLTDVRTPCPAIFEHNPYITKIDDKDSEAEVINCEYPLVHSSNKVPYGFIHGFRMDLQEKLKLPITATAAKGDIYISKEERGWINQVEEITGKPTPFALIISGGKSDFTCKHWAVSRYQEVVDYFYNRIQFIQIGEKAHIHPPLERVINLVGKTSLRQLIRLVYHSFLVVSPVTCLPHLAAAIETKPGMPKIRPSVVIAGGREMPTWEIYNGSTFLDTISALSCSQKGCWKSRVIKIDDGDDSKNNSLCEKPVLAENGQMIARCMDLIKSVDVIRAIEKYMTFYEK